MITNFTIKSKLCKFHALPEAFICLDPHCKSQSFLCSNCVSNSHPHYQHIYTLDQFIAKFASIVHEQRSKLDKCTPAMDIPAIIQAKKSEVEQRQLRLLESLMARLAEEKQVLFQGLDLLEQSYKARQELFEKNLQERAELLQYLTPYMEACLLKLKMLSASDWAITSLKNNLLDLEQLTKIYATRDIEASKMNLLREADSRLQGTLLHTLKAYVKAPLKNSFKVLSANAIPTSKYVPSTNESFIVHTPKMSRLLADPIQFRPRAVSRHELKPASTERRNQSMEMIPKMRVITGRNN